MVQRHVRWRGGASVLALGLALVAGSGPTGCTKQPEPAAAGADEPYVPSIVTGDIQAGIEKHIAEQTARGGGYFRVPFEGGELQLKLVRVHI